MRFNEDEFYFRSKQGYPSASNIPSNQGHVVVGDEVSFSAKKEPSQTVTKLPSSVQEALKDPQRKQAMKTDFDSFCSNQVWTLEKLPKGTKPLKENGTSLRNTTKREIPRNAKRDLLRKVFHKLRVAIPSKPVNQPQECPRYEFCWTLQRSIKCNQDIWTSTAYLNADKEEKVYLEQPERIELKSNEGNQEYFKLQGFIRT